MCASGPTLRIPLLTATSMRNMIVHTTVRDDAIFEQSIGPVPGPVQQACSPARTGQTCAGEEAGDILSATIRSLSGTLGVENPVHEFMCASGPPPSIPILIATYLQYRIVHSGVRADAISDHFIGLILGPMEQACGTVCNGCCRS